MSRLFIYCPTAGIIAEVGDIHNFPDDDELASFAGLTWHQHQSGEFTGEETPMAKTGNTCLRYYLIEAANSVRRHDAEYKKLVRLIFTKLAR